jgi:hypothetical protein
MNTSSNSLRRFDVTHYNNNIGTPALQLTISVTRAIIAIHLLSDLSQRSYL